MLKRYYVNVENLSTEQIVQLKQSFDAQAWTAREILSENRTVKAFDVFLEEKYDFNILFTLPPNCTVIPFE